MNFIITFLGSVICKGTNLFLDTAVIVLLKNDKRAENRFEYLQADRNQR